MKLNHPSKPGVSKSVPDEIAARWLNNGWTEVKAIVPKPAKKAAPKPSKK